MRSSCSIQIDGVSTVNKGAELMLYAILQEIERAHPDATVIYNDTNYTKDNKPSRYFNSQLNVVKPLHTRESIWRLIYHSRIAAITNRVGISLYHALHYHARKNIDYLFNAAGFYVSDQFSISDNDVISFEKYYNKLKNRGTKIVFLPQAFGPCQKPNTKRLLQIICDCSEQIFVRDMSSLNHLEECVGKKSNVLLSPDFTCLVEGSKTERTRIAKNSVCIIPNMQIIRKSQSTKNGYLNFLNEIISFCLSRGETVFLLNHEGIADEKLCKQLQDSHNIPLLSQLNALETKGAIAQAKLVISSRYHGVASALNSAVPCLASSWSHKYQALFEDFNQSNCILEISDINHSLEMIANVLSPINHSQIKHILEQSHIENVLKAQNMWKKIWGQ